ncbi:Zinc finger, RING-CH-type [Parasponia andersonii]|uniref:Zinc finger, RING-CH-type n=1 Tax=Parasponia andersonii TaxID=3476 RepID=A0A2P5CW61_PARAD|nr:Zinc finger, RING-CH-type [Parasponia andersonii]
MADHLDESPLVPPSPITDPTEIDLEAGPGEQIQCRICLETDGRDFIAPCKCKGTSKYVHRECLDHWRAVREGFAFAHCTTCKAPYHLRVHVAADRKWRTLKFRFFVTRDILFIFLTVQLVIASLAYLVYLTDGYQQAWLRRAWGFDSAELYCFSPCLVCLDASLLVMIEECAMTWPSLAVNYAFVAVIQESVQTVIYPELYVCGLTAPHALRAVQVWQENVVAWEEYVVEDVDGEITGSDWSPPPLPPEHVQQLKTLGLL